MRVRSKSRSFVALGAAMASAKFALLGARKPLNLDADDDASSVGTSVASSSSSGSKLSGSKVGPFTLSLASGKVQITVLRICECRRCLKKSYLEFNPLMKGCLL